MSDKPCPDGLIPAHTECPYKRECVLSIERKCRHKGLEHTTNFSCTVYRAFEITKPSPPQGIDK